VFYYLYDGLESDNRLAEFHLDPVLRLHHHYLGEDAQDRETKKVTANHSFICNNIFSTINLNKKYTGIFTTSAQC
jgi:hypothetical protein